MKEKIIKILDKYGRLVIETKDLKDNTDLYEVGLSSHASVNILLSLENEFDIEFPDDVLNKKMFSSINNLIEAVESVTAVK
ncbi:MULTISPECIES: acyl carrier protein [Priestia]|uniref:acyl carrier protein n=1 Tax=Priestia TaxID=2800373 RepID=UPI001ADADB59|nr:MULTISPECIES: acyl carrier protein [Priestia]QTL52730.1 acyl carrier protein [Priestia aryabhattai]USL45324.1 acyl carrier protein [Priestia megaterium]